MNPSSLKHYVEFREILTSYRVSDVGLQTIQGLKLVLMLAPTSSGRNTIIRHLLSEGNYHFIVSDTTRKPRVNDGVLEQDGREYWFKTEEEFLAGLKAGEYLEAELIHNQQVSGINISELQKAQREQKVAISDVDLEGIHNILKAKKDALAIMVVPPSFEEWQKRIAMRGEMSPDEHQRRLETAKRILDDGLKQDYYRFVISDDIERAASTIDSLAQGKPNTQQGRAMELVKQLQFRLDQPVDPNSYGFWHS